MRGGVTILVLCAAGCGRLWFDPSGVSATGDGAAPDDAFILPDVVPLATCEDIVHEMGGSNPWHVPPIAWRDNLIVAGYQANNFGVRRLFDGSHAADVTLTSQQGSPESGDLEVTPYGFLAAWNEGTSISFRPLDANAATLGPAIPAATGVAARLAQNGGEILLAWRDQTSLVVRRFSYDGSPLAAPSPLDVPVPVTGRFTITEYLSGYAVVAKELSTSNAVLARLDAAGAVTQLVPFPVSSTQTQDIQVVSIGADNIVAWIAGPNVFFSRIHADGTVDPPTSTVSFSNSQSQRIALAWTRDRLALASSRIEPTNLVNALQWLDESGNPLGPEIGLDSFPWSDTAQTQQPTIIGAPGRAAAVFSFRFLPQDSEQQSVHQRCY